jgi:hypothetical protein
MRDLEAGLTDRLDAINQQIEIERPGPVGKAGSAVTAKLPFDRQQGLKQGARAEFGFKRNHRVEEARLGSVAYRLGGVEPRSRRQAAHRSQPRDGLSQRGGRRPCTAGKVGAQTDVCGWHPSQLTALAVGTGPNPRAVPASAQWTRLCAPAEARRQDRSGPGPAPRQRR